MGKGRAEARSPLTTLKKHQLPLVPGKLADMLSDLRHRVRTTKEPFLGWVGWAKPWV